MKLQKASGYPHTLLLSWLCSQSRERVIGAASFSDENVHSHYTPVAYGRRIGSQPEGVYDALMKGEERKVRTGKEMTKDIRRTISFRQKQ